MPDQPQSPLDAFRSRYPDYKEWGDSEIYNNLSDPAKFKRAFPEYQDWDDATVLKNVVKFAPKTWLDNYPSVEKGLQFVNKTLVQPIEELAKAGGEIGAKYGGALLAGPTALGIGIGAALPKGSPSQAAVQSFTQGVGSDVGRMTGSFIADPRNWPFLGSGAMRPALKTAVSGLFAAMQGTNAAQDLNAAWNTDNPEEKRARYQSAGVNAAFTLMGLSHMPGEVRETLLDRMKEQATEEQPPATTPTVAPRTPGSPENIPPNLLPRQKLIPGPNPELNKGAQFPGPQAINYDLIAGQTTPAAQAELGLGRAAGMADYAGPGALEPRLEGAYDVVPNRPNQALPFSAFPKVEPTFTPEGEPNLGPEGGGLPPTEAQPPDTGQGSVPSDPNLHTAQALMATLQQRGAIPREEPLPPTDRRGDPGTRTAFDTWLQQEKGLTHEQFMGLEPEEHGAIRGDFAHSGLQKMQELASGAAPEIPGGPLLAGVAQGEALPPAPDLDGAISGVERARKQIQQTQARLNRAGSDTEEQGALAKLVRLNKEDLPRAKQTLLNTLKQIGREAPAKARGYLKGLEDKLAAFRAQRDEIQRHIDNFGKEAHYRELLGDQLDPEKHGPMVRELLGEEPKFVEGITRRGGTTSFTDVDVEGLTEAGDRAHGAPPKLRLTKKVGKTELGFYRRLDPEQAAKIHTMLGDEPAQRIRTVSVPTDEEIHAFVKQANTGNERLQKLAAKKVAEFQKRQVDVQDPAMQERVAKYVQTQADKLQAHYQALGGVLHEKLTALQAERSNPTVTRSQLGKRPFSAYLQEKFNVSSIDYQKLLGFERALATFNRLHEQAAQGKVVLQTDQKWSKPGVQKTPLGTIITGPGPRKGAPTENIPRTSSEFWQKVTGLTGSRGRPSIEDLRAFNADLDERFKLGLQSARALKRAAKIKEKTYVDEFATKRGQKRLPEGQSPVPSTDRVVNLLDRAMSASPESPSLLQKLPDLYRNLVLALPEKLQNALFRNIPRGIDILKKGVDDRIVLAIGKLGGKVIPDNFLDNPESWGRTFVKSKTVGIRAKGVLERAIDWAQFHKGPYTVYTMNQTAAHELGHVIFEAMYDKGILPEESTVKSTLLKEFSSASADIADRSNYNTLSSADQAHELFANAFAHWYEGGGPKDGGIISKLITSDPELSNAVSHLRDAAKDFKGSRTPLGKLSLSKLGEASLGVGPGDVAFNPSGNKPLEVLMNEKDLARYKELFTKFHAEEGTKEPYPFHTQAVGLNQEEFDEFQRLEDKLNAAVKEAKFFTPKSSDVAMNPARGFSPPQKVSEYLDNLRKNIDTLKGSVKILPLGESDPTPSRAWITPDGSHAIDLSSSLHEAVARRLVYGKDHNSTEAHLRAEDHLLNQGWIRKAYDATFETGKLTPDTLSVIERDLINTDAQKPFHPNDYIRLDIPFTKLRDAKIPSRLTVQDWKDNDFKLEGVRPNLPDSVAMNPSGFRQGTKALKDAWASSKGDKALEQQVEGDLLNKVGKDKLAQEAIIGKLGPYLTSLARMDKDDFLSFSDAIEHGRTQNNGNWDNLAKLWHDDLNPEAVKAVQALGTGKFQHWIENYFPHIWDDPKHAGDVIRAIIGGRRPLEGMKSFLYERHILDTRTGMEQHGLKPMSYNPAEIMLAKQAEMYKYVHAHEMKAELVEAGRAKWVPDNVKEPDGWQPLSDKIFSDYEETTSPTGTPTYIRKRGQYYAPPPVASTLNKYLSPGLGGYKGYQIARQLGNGIIQFKLGFSGYHGIQTTINSIASDAGLAMGMLSRGDIGEFKKGPDWRPILTDGAIRQFLQTSTLKSPALAAVDTLSKFIPGMKESHFSPGSKLIAEREQPGSFPEVGQVAHEGMVQAGGGSYQQAAYMNDAVRNFWKAWQDKSPSLPLRAAGVVMEKLSNPLFRDYIPRVKNAAFYSKATDIYRRFPEDTPERRQELREAWDSIDNRFGQLHKDRLFWDNALKDVSQLLMQSPTWTIGSFREVGGAAKETINMPKRMMAGKGLGAHTEGVLGYVGTAVLANAALHWILTGKQPHGKDYFFPASAVDATGRVIERLAPEGYIKDAFNFAHDWKKTLADKIHPLLVGAIDIWRNADYKGTQVIPDDASLADYATATLGHLAKQAIPISVEGALREKEQFGSPRQIGQSFFGFNPAPKWLDQTDAEKLASELALRDMPRGPRTKEQAAAADYRRQLHLGLDAGRLQPGDVAGEVSKGKLSPSQAQSILEERVTHPDMLSREVNKFNAPSAMLVWRRATEDERDRLRPIIVKKLSDAIELSPQEDVPGLLQDIQEIFGGGAMPR